MPLTTIPRRLVRGLRQSCLPRRAGTSRVPFFPLLALCSVLAAGVAQGQLSFGPGTYYSAGPAPRAVALGDLNRDGWPDLVVANYNANSISVRLNQSGAGFGAATTFDSGVNPAHVVLADLDGDGDLDAVAANQGPTANSVSVFLGNGAGSFAPRVDYAGGPLPTFLAVGDLNHDLRPDLVVANNGDSRITTLLNVGAGRFGGPGTVGVSAPPTGVAIGQLNADGHPDVVACGNSNTVNVLIGNGSGGFQGVGNTQVTYTPSSVAVADMNRDGKQDLVLGFLDGARIGVAAGRGDGTFAAATAYSAGLYPVALVAEDMTGDGWPDVVVANHTGYSMSLFYGNGLGGLNALGNVALPARPISLAAGDVNGDGLPDLAVASNSSNLVSIFRQVPSPPLIRVIPTSLAFGQVYANVPKTLSVQIQNIGSQPLSVTGTPVTGTGFSVLDATPFSLGRGEYRDLRVQFAPGSSGSSSGTLTIQSTDATRPSVAVALSGSGVYPPVAEVSPASLALAAPAGAADTEILEVRNTGLGSMTFSLATVGPRPSWLSFTPAIGTVPPGGSVQVTVRGDALSLFDGTYTAVLRVSCNDPLRPQTDVPITFAVTGTPRIAVTPASLDYGAGYQAFPETLLVQVRNTGTDTLLVNSMSTDSPEFVVSPPTAFALVPTALRSCAVIYRRQAEGSFTASLSIENNDPSAPTVTVPLSGSAVDAPHIVVDPAAFPPVVVTLGDSILLPLTITNTSHATRLDVQLQPGQVPGLSATPPFGVSPTSASIDPGGSHGFLVAFRGVNRPGQDLSADLSVISNDPRIPLVTRALTLHVLGRPRLGLSTSTLDFGAGFTGVPDTLLLTVSSIGSDTLLVSGIVSSDLEFSVLDPTALVMAPGASRPLRVRYARSSVRDPDARLTLSSNDPGQPAANVRLLGSTRKPPVVRVSPASINVAVVLGDSAVVPLSITNNGLGPLDFSINVRRPPPPSPLSVAAGEEEKVYSADDPNPEAARAPPADAGAPYRDTGPHTLSATRVLVIGDGGTESDVVPILTGAGYQVTLVSDDTAWNGSNPSPDAFGTVVLLDGIDFGDDMPVAGQQALLDFVRGGGGVVVTEWISYEVSQGRYASMRPLVPITRTTGVTGVFNYTVVASHAVTEGVNPTFAVTAAVTRGTTNSGTAVVRLSTGDPAVVVKEEGLGRVAAFALAGNYNGRRPFLSADMRRLLLNAVSWTSGLRWLSWSPRSGEVIPGGKQIVNVKVTTAGLAPGTETVELLVDSNDPTTPRLVVPLRLTVLTVPTPVLASLVRQEADADRVRLVWYVAGADLPLATVYRSRAGEGWRALRELEADGSGLIVFEDRDVAPGESYGYRIGLREAGAERIAGETWLVTPAAVFALHGVWPTPSDRDLVVSFSLPDRRGGRIELFDVRGRRWMELPLDRMGPGRHDAHLDARGVAPPGIYWVRLTSGARSLTARAILLR